MILPALLRGKLQDLYTTLSDDVKKDLAALKRALSDRAGLISVSEEVYGKDAGCERVCRKLFTNAYPGEDASKSSVLLGRFVTGFILSELSSNNELGRCCCVV